MDEHSVPTLAMDSRTSTFKLHPVVPPPLKLVRMLLRLSTQYPVLPLPAQRMFVHCSWLQNIKLTRVRCPGIYKLVTYLGVGRCVTYTASGPSALGYVNHAAPTPGYVTGSTVYTGIAMGGPAIHLLSVSI